MRNPEQTLARLVAAGRETFGRLGYERATVDAIVRAAGVSKGAFYTHFPSKEALFLLLLERRLDHNRARFLQTCRPEASAADWITCVVETICSFAQEDPTWSALSVEFMAHAMRDTGLGQRIATMHHAWRDLIAASLRESEDFRTGRMTVEPDTVAVCLVALLDGLIIQGRVEADGPTLAERARSLGPLLQAWFPSSRGSAWTP
jgi:AcrR family transcriptional regulator